MCADECSSIHYHVSSMNGYTHRMRKDSKRRSSRVILWRRRALGVLCFVRCDALCVCVFLVSSSRRKRKILLMCGPDRNRVIFWWFVHRFFVISIEAWRNKKKVASRFSRDESIRACSHWLTVNRKSNNGVYIYNLAVLQCRP